MRVEHEDTKVIAIVITFNPNLSILKEQWASIKPQVDAVIYIDNGSDNSSTIKNFLDQIAADGGCIYSRFNSENRGIGFAQNQGIALAQQLVFDFVLLLDHDSVLKDNFTNRLINEYKNLQNSGFKIAAVGPVYINENTSERYPISRYIGPFIKRIYPNEHVYVEASFLIASGSLIPLSIISEVGPMNEDLFVDYVDIEWSFRARKHGYHLYAITSALMHHQIGDRRISVLGRKISVHSPVRRYFLARNSIFMIKSPYIAAGYKLRELIFNVLRIAIFFFIFRNRIEYLKFSVLGVIDGLKGKFGPCSRR